jgi:hypothetical protein
VWSFHVGINSSTKRQPKGAQRHRFPSQIRRVFSLVSARSRSAGQGQSKGTVGSVLVAVAASEDSVEKIIPPKAKGGIATWREPCFVSIIRVQTEGDARWRCLLVAECGVEAHDRLLLLRGEHAVLQPRPQVVDPPQPAALAVPVQPCRRPEPYNFENQCTFVFVLKKLCIYDNTHAQKKKGNKNKKQRTLFLLQKREVQSEPAARGIQLTLFLILGAPPALGRNADAVDYYWSYRLSQGARSSSHGCSGGCSRGASGPPPATTGPFGSWALVCRTPCTPLPENVSAAAS